MKLCTLNLNSWNPKKEKEEKKMIQESTRKEKAETSDQVGTSPMIVKLTLKVHIQWIGYIDAEKRLNK